MQSKKSKSLLEPCPYAFFAARVDLSHCSLGIRLSLPPLHRKLTCLSACQPVSLYDYTENVPECDVRMSLADACLPLGPPQYFSQFSKKVVSPRKASELSLRPIINVTTIGTMIACNWWILGHSTWIRSIILVSWTVERSWSLVVWLDPAERLCRHLTQWTLEIYLPLSILISWPPKNGAVLFRVSSK